MPRKCKTKTKIKKRKPKFLSLRHLNLNHTPVEAEEETTAADFFAAAVDGCSATLAALFGSNSPSDDTCDGTAHVSMIRSPSLTCTKDPAHVSITRSPSLTCTKDPAHDSKTWSPALTCTGDLVQDSETWSPSLTCARDMTQDNEMLSPSLTCVRDMAQESEMLSPSLTCVRDMAQESEMLSPSLTCIRDMAQESEMLSPPLTCVRGMAQDSEMLSPSLTCTGRDIFRGAMRGSEGREEREEKWVCYEEVTSCAADVRVKVRSRGLSLKLDYQEIIDAWCDKGSLYMPGPQTVPDLCDDFLSYGDGLNDGWRSNGSLWTVPENTVGNEGVKEEHGLVEELKTRHREASLLRYKEKRQNRLFSKRIRYEVRKINAEKRPRMKGRFVKRN